MSDSSVRRKAIASSTAFAMAAGAEAAERLADAVRLERVGRRGRIDE